MITQSTFPLGVEKTSTSYSKTDLSACDRNGKEVESGSDGCAKLRCCWHLCTTFALFITFTHLHAAHVILTISCGRSLLNCYLMDSAPENHQSVISDIYSISQAQSNKCPHINGIFW